MPSSADSFQICEVKVALAAFGRKLEAKYNGVPEPDQHKFWNLETHLLYPTADDVCNVTIAILSYFT